MIDANAFNFDALKEQLGTNPFEDKSKQYAKDERFYTLQKDKDGNGAALIRFLPDSEKNMLQRLYKINTTIVKDGKKRFVNNFSPNTIGKPCPFQEMWQELWNSGKKDEARQFGRSIKYVTNIKVLKDPANPENEGRVFLYEMSGAMKEKVQNAVDPSEQDRSLGAKPKELFNPIKGNSFRLVARKGSNGQINYDSSEVINEETSIYESAEEALEEIKNRTYTLSDLLKPESFMSYEELKDKMEWVTFNKAAPNSNSDAGNTQGPVTTTVAEPQRPQSEVNEASQTSQQTTQQSAPQAQSEAQPETQQKEESKSAQQSQNLDSLLDGLM